MSWDAIKYVREVLAGPKHRDLGSVDRIVLKDLGEFCGDTKDGELTYPSLRTLAEQAGKSTRTVQRSLVTLEKRGIILREEGGDGLKGIRYRFPKSTPDTQMSRVEAATDDTQMSGVNTLPTTKTAPTHDKNAIVLSEEQKQQKNTAALSETSENPFALTPQKQTEKSSKTDPRWQGFIRHISAYWKENHPSTFPFPFTPADGKQLKAFLASNPHLGEEQFAELVRNRSRSRANHSEPPHKWLNGAIRYAGGALDEFGKPIQQHPKKKLRAVNE